jgi:hypothetical protein
MAADHRTADRQTITPLMRCSNTKRSNNALDADASCILMAVLRQCRIRLVADVRNNSFQNHF